MGIDNLSKIIGQYKQTKSLSDYHGQTWGIDTSLYMHRFMCFNKNNYLGSFLNQIIQLLSNNIIPVYIFDGKPPPAKDKELSERREQKVKLKNKLDELDPESKEYKKTEMLLNKPTMNGSEMN